MLIELYRGHYTKRVGVDVVLDDARLLAGKWVLDHKHQVGTDANVEDHRCSPKEGF